LLAEIELI